MCVCVCVCVCVCALRLQPLAGGAAGSFSLVLGGPQTPVSGQRWKHFGGMAVDGRQTGEQKTFALLPLCPKWVPTRLCPPSATFGNGTVCVTTVTASAHSGTPRVWVSQTASLSSDHVVCGFQTASMGFRFVDPMAAMPRFICLHKRD